MKVKFMSATPVRFGDVKVKVGDVLDLDQKTAEEALRGGLFVTVEPAKPKAKPKKKTTTKIEEES